MNIPLKSIKNPTSIASFARSLSMLLFILPIFGIGQVKTLGIPFQAVAKDYSGNLVNQRIVYIDLEISEKDLSGQVLLNELHKTKTDEWGLFSISIGKGKYIGGQFDQISQLDWSTGKYQLQIKMAIEPEAPLPNWDYKQHLIVLGSTAFGIVPYALYSIASGGVDGSVNEKLDLKLNIADTVKMLTNYTKQSLTVAIQNKLTEKLSIQDTTQMLYPYIKKSATLDKISIDSLLNSKMSTQDSGIKYITPSQLKAITFDTLSIYNRIEARVKFSDTVHLSNRINERLKFSDTSYLSNRIEERVRFSDTIYLSNRINSKFNVDDTIYLSNRIALRESLSNKSLDLTSIADYSDQKYPTVKATKDYVDNQVAGIGIPDASITDAKIASGIQASKVGLSNVTNHAQLYHLNGLTAQVQNFANPSTAGLLPNWVSVGAAHTLNIPMANASAVTAGLISKVDYDHFNAGYTNSINSFTTTGNAGAASFSGQVLNIPQYTLAGLSGTVNPNYFLAGPSSGVAGAVQYRAITAADIPNNASNTSGNAATATALATPRTINSVVFDGTANITVKASTTNKLFFSVAGFGAAPNEGFDGSNSKIISYNTIGAAPISGSVNITTLGTIATGVWNGSVISEAVGGAGSVNGILKADGNGMVSAATSSDFQLPLSFTAPLSNTSNTISIQQANANIGGYLSNTDWNTFNNKIDPSEKAVANGIATLDASGKIPTSQVPAISFSSGYVVNSQAQMLSIPTAALGTIAIRTDNSKNYVLSGNDPRVLSNWLELLMPAAVSSVNGYTTGSIVLTSSDINEGTNLYFNNARVRSAVDGFLGAEAPLNYNTSAAKMSITQAGTSASGYLSATDWNTFNNKMTTLGVQSANTFYAAPNGIAGAPIFRALVPADIPTLNQNTTGNAATATSLEFPKNINGVAFNGTADITLAANTNSAITFNNSGTGALSSSSFNGSGPVTISYNTIGALPSVGASSITTLGTITTGTWNGAIIASNYGGAGANNGILKANGTGTVSTAVVGTDYEAPLSFTAPLNKSSNTVAIQTATSSNSGVLSASDWQLFNNKQVAIVGGTGVIVSGGNTINIGQAVATTNAPSFAGITLSGLNVSGIVANAASGALSTIGTTGTGLVVKENTPTLITPNLGAANANSINVTGDITAKRFKLTMPTATVAAATTNLDLSTGNVFTINLGTNIATLTTSNPVLGTYLVKFVQDATGSRTVSFPTAWKWAGGIVPTLTTTASKLDIVTLVYDGTTFYATIVKNF